MRNLVLKNQLIYGTVNAGQDAFDAAVAQSDSPLLPGLGRTDVNILVSSSTGDRERFRDGDCAGCGIFVDGQVRLALPFVPRSPRRGGSR